MSGSWRQRATQTPRPPAIRWAVDWLVRSALVSSYAATIPTDARRFGDPASNEFPLREVTAMGDFDVDINIRSLDPTVAPLTDTDALIGRLVENARNPESAAFEAAYAGLVSGFMQGDASSVAGVLNALALAQRGEIGVLRDSNTLINGNFFSTLPYGIRAQAAELAAARDLQDSKLDLAFDLTPPPRVPPPLDETPEPEPPLPPEPNAPPEAPPSPPEAPTTDEGTPGEF
jgi:hypothetical protein